MLRYFKDTYENWVLFLFRLNRFSNDDFYFW